MDTRHLEQPTAKSQPKRNLKLWLIVCIFGILCAVLIFYFAGASVHTPTAAVPVTAKQAAPVAHDVVNPRPARSAIPTTSPKDDAATQGTFNYLRVHEQIPDSVILHLYNDGLNGPD